MARYKVLRDCTFQSRYYEQGEEANFADNVKVPHHFASLGSKLAQELEAKEKDKEAEVEAEPKTMHEMAKRRNKVAGSN